MRSCRLRSKGSIRPSEAKDMDVFRAKTAILAFAGRTKARRARPEAGDAARHGKPEAATGAKQKAIPALTCGGIP
ncbi:hypothetical protein BC2230_30552 [Burkholderia cepacia]